ncbi:MAG TPA: ATP-binding protein, partial [Acidobacteriota bacterium]
HRYVSVEPPDVRLAAATDPRGFLEFYKPPVIIDEVQHAPELLPYIKERIDADRDKPGQYILSGSQNLLLVERVGETLAGRAAVLRLLPLSLKELRGCKNEPLLASATKSNAGAVFPAFSDLWKIVLRGFYPEIAADKKRDAQLWHSSYLQTYIERDVRTLRQIGDLMTFQTFLSALAARNGQLLNMTELSRDIGVSQNTSKAWLAALEASYQVIVLRPYYRNIGKRLVKSPKVYFTDTGTLCSLSGISDIEQLSKGPMAGAIFETVVLMEIIKHETHHGRVPKVYFWRTADGAEVDIIYESNGSIIPIEVKLSATPNPAMTAGIAKFRQAYGGLAAVGNGYIVHPGDVALPMGGVLALPVGRM